MKEVWKEIAEAIWKDPVAKAAVVALSCVGSLVFIYLIFYGLFTWIG